MYLVVKIDSRTHERIWSTKVATKEEAREMAKELNRENMDDGIFYDYTYDV